MIISRSTLSLQIDGGSFEILLEYLEGLQGKSKKVTVSEAEKVLVKTEEDDAGWFGLCRFILV